MILDKRNYETRILAGRAGMQPEVCSHGDVFILLFYQLMSASVLLFGWLLLKYCIVINGVFGMKETVCFMKNFISVWLLMYPSEKRKVGKFLVKL
uniref:Putative ovule protein n=1 Tax=Solanum chacoense TaxID=4108 RepID=A0A0V0H3W3_SOLCH